MSPVPWLPVLEELYGPKVAAELSPKVGALINSARSRLSAGPQPLSEKDSWLITYADQFQDGDRPPLQVLGGFLDRNTTPWITGIHILPFYPWSSDDGFSVKDYAAVDPDYGNWEDISALATGRRLMADAVINHMSAESEWFRAYLAEDPEYADFFMTADPNADLSATVRPRTTPLLTKFDAASGERWVWTTFSADQVDLDYRNPRVLLRVLEVLLGYVAHGATAIRLDAIGFLWKIPGTSCMHLPQTHAVVHCMRLCLDAAAPGSVLITETNVPHAENVSYFGTTERPEAQLVYQFPLAPLVLDALTTGDATVLTSWAASLETPVPNTSFLNFLASHDGVGVRPVEGLIPTERVRALADLARRAGGGVGERTLNDGTIVPYELNSTWYDMMAVDHPEEDAIRRHLAAHAVMFALAGVPLIYVHSLLGSSNDAAGYQATGRPRSYNRQKFVDVTDLEASLADETTRAAQIFSHIKAMALVRANHEAFHPFASQRVIGAAPALLVVSRVRGDAEALVVVNLSGNPVDYELPARRWDSLLGTSPADGVLRIAGWDACWLSAV